VGTKELTVREPMRANSSNRWCHDFQFRG